MLPTRELLVAPGSQDTAPSTPCTQQKEGRELMPGEAMASGGMAGQKPVGFPLEESRPNSFQICQATCMVHPVSPAFLSTSEKKQSKRPL